MLHTKTRVKNIIPIIKLKKLQWFVHLKRSKQQFKIKFEGLMEWKKKKGDLPGDGETILQNGVEEPVWKN